MSKLLLDEPEKGIHRAKLWEIGFYALNNTSTNAYMLLMNSVVYFLTGMVGVAVVLASSLITLLRIWDGVTDPFIGMLVDNTNTKLGKNRPFIIAGNVILFVTSFCMFNFIPKIPQGGRFIVFLILWLIYIIGYTFQCVVTKSAQTCMTNDPKQRPIFTMFDATYNTILFSVWFPIWLASTLMPTFTLSSATEEGAAAIANYVAQNPTLEKALSVGEDGITTLNALYNPACWIHMQRTIAIISAIFAILAIIGISRKDNEKYFGVGGGSNAKIGFKDYIDVLAHNRGIQMLIVAASSDKLCTSTMGNATVLICLYGVILGNYALSGSVSAITGVPVALFGIIGVGYVARQMGQKKCLMVGTWGSIFSMLAICVLIFMRPTMMIPTGFSLTKPATYGVLFSGWNFIGILFVLLFILVKGFSSMSGGIVIPMTADCADYEVYRSKRYVPGLMGTLFSFVDKLISSLAATIVGICFAAIGFSEVMPTTETPFSMGIMWVTLFLFGGMPFLGWMCNVVSMKFYPLTKEYMEEIQDEIAAIKNAAK